MIACKIKMTEEEMGRFMTAYNYSSGAGIAILILGILAALLAVWRFVASDMGLGVLLLVVAMVFLIYQPLAVRSRAKKQVREAKTLRDEVTYEFRPEGLNVRQDKKGIFYSWSCIQQVSVCGGMLLLYVTRGYAYGLPIAQIGDSYGSVVEMLRQQVAPERIKLKEA